MKAKMVKLSLAVLVLALLLGMAPARSLNAEAALYHSLEDALLLMISSHMRISGEVTSASLPGGGHLLLRSPQEGDPSEVDILIELYEAQVQKLRDSDDFDLDLQDRLITNLEDKLVALNAKAQAVNATRTPPRRSGGILGKIVTGINRGIKGLGRGLGRLVGGLMDGAGKIAEFAIEEVAPRVLKEAIQGGAPLNAALVRRITRELLWKRAERLGERELVKLADRINRRKEAAANEGFPTLNPTERAFADDLMDLESADATRESSNTPAGGGSNSGGNAEPDLVTVDLVATDTLNFRNGGDWRIGELNWEGRWGRQSDGYFCYWKKIPMTNGTVHLEFNQAAMTVSGWVEASGQETSYFALGSQMYKIGGNIQVIFLDLPVVPVINETGVALRFAGEGEGTGTVSGTVTCDKTEGGEYTSYSTSDQASNSNPVPVSITLYIPGYTSGGSPISMNISAIPGVEPVNGFAYNFSFSFDQPVDVPLP